MTKIDGIFGEMDFSVMKEADVREEIVTPLLKKIGYGIPEAVITRQPRLNHPFLKYGHRETPIQAEPDYLLEIDGNFRWILEAKPPEPFKDQDIFQTYSYTVHHEVNGIYFALCNGLELRVYRTHTFKAGVDPVFARRYEEFAQNLRKLENVIGPAAIRRDYPIAEIDTEEPLGPGLRSKARIVRGLIRLFSPDSRFRSLDGLTLTIVGGTVFRDENGCIACTVDTCAPIVEMQAINEKLGLESMGMSSEVSLLSTEAALPTVLLSQRSVHLPKDMLLPIMGSTQQRLFYDTDCNTATVARGTLDGQIFKGDFEATYEFFYSELTACNRSPFVQRGPTVTLAGNFEAELK